MRLDADRMRRTRSTCPWSSFIRLLWENGRYPRWIFHSHLSRGCTALVRADDIVMGFGPPEGDAEVWAALNVARDAKAMTFALPGNEGSYFAETGTHDPFIHQELIEMLYHTLWETVHVFFEHRELGHEVGDAAFLYPFLGKNKQETCDVVAEVAASIRDEGAG